MFQRVNLRVSWTTDPIETLGALKLLSVGSLLSVRSVILPLHHFHILRQLIQPIHQRLNLPARGLERSTSSCQVCRR
jgi:hypothetical protein